MATPCFGGRAWHLQYEAQLCPPTGWCRLPGALLGTRVVKTGRSCSHSKLNGTHSGQGPRTILGVPANKTTLL